jgi:L-alanine-DL-glutamate epimerase-like enolase superfamily enzyme
MRFELSEDLSALAQIRISCVLGCRHVTRRSKFIGRNAKKDVHGWEGHENVVRLFTDQGLDGVGFGNVTPEQAQALIGRSLADIWRATAEGARPLGRADQALFDLTGKALGKPVWALLGGEGPEWVPVYDTSLYFSDLLPEHEGRGAACLIDELDAGLRLGHRAFKVKVGRGARWMDPEEGLARDIEVVRTLAAHAGPGIALMADANDQYGPETTKRFLGEVGHLLLFAEEMFPEDAATGRAMREWIAARGLGTKLADGESEHDPLVHAALARAGALDILQPDIRALGLGLQCALARAVGDLPDVRIAAHNWGSYLGTFKMLQLGRGIGNFQIAELDRMTSDLFDDSEWELREGAMRVPDTPGAGLRLSEAVFRERYLPTAWIVGDERMATAA